MGNKNEVERLEKEMLMSSREDMERGVCTSLSSAASDGYHWEVDDTNPMGHRTTAIYQLRNLQGQTLADLLAAQDIIEKLEEQLAAEREANQSLLLNLALVSGDHHFDRVADTP